MIKVENLTKRYGTKIAVDDVTFQVNDGEVVGFLGRNGAGKSTTMNILTGYISSTAGHCTVDGYDILKDPIEVKKRIGYLPEQPPVYMDMTINEYLTFVCEIKGVPRKERKEEIERVCESVDLADMRKRLIKNLSKGYKQRAGLAQALIGNPDVLVLDEPTVGLDPRQIIEIRQLVKNLGKKHTIILSSHILHEVADICERVIILDQGKIVAQDTLANLAANVNEISRLTLRVRGGDALVRKTLHDLHGITYVEAMGVKEPDTVDYLVECEPKTDVRADIFKAMSDMRRPILMMRPMDVTLEDIFLQLTSGEEE